MSRKYARSRPYRVGIVWWHGVKSSRIKTVL